MYKNIHGQILNAILFPCKHLYHVCILTYYGISTSYFLFNYRCARSRKDIKKQRMISKKICLRFLFNKKSNKKKGALYFESAFFLFSFFTCYCLDIAVHWTDITVHWTDRPLGLAAPRDERFAKAILRTTEPHHCQGLSAVYPQLHM